MLPKIHIGIDYGEPTNEYMERAYYRISDLYGSDSVAAQIMSDQFEEIGRAHV